MRTGLLIADFEMSFTTSFKHTARVKYNVDFTSSNVHSIQENVQTLKANILAGNVNNVHVGYNFGMPEVEHVEMLLNTLLSRYMEYFKSIPPNRKIYTLLQQLRDAETPTTKQMAKDVLNEILTPPPKEKLSRQEQIKADAKQKSKERALELIRKRGIKKGNN